MSQTSRRLYPRQIRRLAVRFWREAEDRPRQGFTKNVSLTGAFVSTPDPAGRGERLRLELSDAGRTALLHAVVVHAHRVPPELRRFADSAMGLRFLGLDELVGPFLGDGALRAEEATAERGERRLGGSGALPFGGVRSPAGTAGTAGPAAAGSVEPPRPAGAAPPRQTNTASPPVAAAAPAAVPAGGPTATYVLAFTTGDDFLATYRRDLANGGLFVTTDRPARLHERVAVDLRVPGATAATVRVEGRVVQVVEPRLLASGRTAGGMGLELVDPDAALRRLAPLVAAFER